MFKAAKKSFGQNFLVEQSYIEKIIKAVNPQNNDTIVEIGAGRGALTERLVESGANVIAIELDRDLIPYLKDKFRDAQNFQLVASDALQIDFSELTQTVELESKVKLAANLPYNISTAILQKLIVQREIFSEMILMFQREVVERITAEPGNSDRGFLSVLTDAYFTVEKLFDVPPNAFRPAPKVWSSIARLIPKEADDFEIENFELFREIVSAGFVQKRKTLVNNLKNEYPAAEAVLNDCGIDARSRAETLSIEDWKYLTKGLSAEN